MRGPGLGRWSENISTPWPGVAILLPAAGHGGGGG